MKKNLLLTAVVLLYLFQGQTLKAQSGVGVVTVSYPQPKLYVGSLPKGHPSGINQKLKVEVFGGSFSASNLGVTTFYISNREENLVNKERHGGDGEYFALKVYESPTTYDFVIESTATWTSYTVHSEYLSNAVGVTPLAPVNIVAYNPGTNPEVTSLFRVNTIFTTTRDGNIGIGVERAQSKLDVNGTIRAREVKIELANWADHVFNPEYDLMDLNELSGYVANNRHLPGIPTSQEVMENGVDMGKLNVMLLQKIEELTLYAIGLKKEVDGLKQTGIKNQTSNTYGYE